MIGTKYNFWSNLLNFYRFKTINWQGRSNKAPRALQCSVVVKCGNVLNIWLSQHSWMLHRKVSGSRSSSTLSSEKHQPVGLIYVLWLLFWNVKFRQMVVNSRTRIRNSVYHDVVDTLNNSHGDTITTTPQHYGDHSIPLGAQVNISQNPCGGEAKEVFILATNICI